MKGGKVAMSSKTTIMGRPFMKIPPSIIMNALDEEKWTKEIRDTPYLFVILETSKLWEQSKRYLQKWKTELFLYNIIVINSIVICRGWIPLFLCPSPPPRKLLCFKWSLSNLTDKGSWSVITSLKRQNLFKVVLQFLTNSKWTVYIITNIKWDVVRTNCV